MRVRVRGLGAIVIALALVFAACGSDDDSSSSSGDDDKSITIASFNFTESELLANMYATVLKDAGYKVTPRFKLGTRDVVEPALEKGEIDLVPEYVGTALEKINNSAGEASGDLAATTKKLRERFKAKGVSVLEPSKAQDQNAFAVTKATADKLKLTKMSDLAPHAATLTLGGPPECPTRPFCQPGLDRVYGLKFKTFKPLDVGGPLTKDALANASIDVGLVFSSDGAVAARGFVVLDDDKGLQAVDNVVPVIRTDKLTDDVEEALNKISEELTTKDLQELNKRMDVDKEDPATVATDWLADHDLTKKK